MTIKDDIQTLMALQEAYYVANGRFLRTNPTPAIIPKVNNTTTFTKLEKWPGEPDQFNFIPTAKDYQFRTIGSKHRQHSNNVDTRIVYTFFVEAKRDLGSGIIETIRYYAGDSHKVILP